MKSLAHTGLVLLVVFVTLVVWTGYHSVRAPLEQRCFSLCDDFAAFQEHYPFCIIDPSCAVPWHNASRPASDIDHTHYWVGVAAGAFNLPSAQLASPGSRSFAIPNYVLFMLLLSGIVVLVIRVARRLFVRILALTAVFVWTTAEVISWFIAAARLDDTLNPVVVIEAIVVLMVSLGVLAAVARVSLGHSQFVSRSAV